MLIFSRYTWWMGAMGALVLLLAIFGQVGLLSPFQGAFLSVTAPVERALSGVFQPVAAFLSDAGNIRGLQSENRELRLQVEELQTRLIQAEQDAERVQELEAALGIETTGGETHLPASILTRVTQPLTATVSIDKGSADGVQAGMVVLSTRGTLIGTVTSVDEGRSFVRLVSDSRSKVGAEVLESKADGVVKGGINGELALELAQSEIAVGDTVVTSGIGGNYPPGVPIGRVTKVSGTNQDLFRKVQVEPLVRISTARTVLVLTSFVPLRVGLGEP